MRIAVIPARGGSKRIPRKNIRLFCGKPMIVYAIKAAQETKLFDHIIVSTNDAEIATVARQWGAEVPFMRPAKLSDDYSGTTEVITHASQWAIDQNWPLTAICCIYATAPFIQVKDIQKGLEVLESEDCLYSFSATDFAAPIFRAFQQHPQGGIEMFFPEHFSTRSQDLPQALHDAGQFYWGRPSAWIAGKRVFDRYSIPIIIPRWRVQDIDTQEDWERAEMIFTLINHTSNII